MTRPWKLTLATLGLVILALGGSVLAFLRPWAPDPRKSLDEAQRQQRIHELYDGYRATFPGVPTLSADDLAQRLDDTDHPPPVLVDIRSADEQAVSTLPGALTQDRFQALLAQDPQRFQNAEIITYCTIGFRSGLYAQQLQAQGLDARNLAGSLLAWTYTGRPLQHDGEPTRDLHVWGKRFNLAADGYDTTW